MYAPEHIVVPVDFSALSRSAVARAASLARRFETPLHLVHGTPYAMAPWTHEFALPAGTWEALRSDAEEQLAQLEKQLREDGLEVTAEVQPAGPVAAIEAVCAKHGSTLVVMGTHGYSGLRHVMLGSVTEQTLRTVEAPILAVKEPVEEAAAPIGRILYATDFSLHAQRAGEVARGLAKRLEAHLDIVHAFQLPASLAGAYDIPASPELLTTLREKAESLLATALEACEAAGLSCRAHLVDGFASEVVSAEARRLGSRLVVMGTRGSSGLAHILLGSVAERTLRSAPCSVLAARATTEG